MLEENLILFVSILCFIGGVLYDKLYINCL